MRKKFQSHKVSVSLRICVQWQERTLSNSMKIQKLFFELQKFAERAGPKKTNPLSYFTLKKMWVRSSLTKTRRKMGMMSHNKFIQMHLLQSSRIQHLSFTQLAARLWEARIGLRRTQSNTLKSVLCPGYIKIWLKTLWEGQLHIHVYLSTAHHQNGFCPEYTSPCMQRCVTVPTR